MIECYTPGQVATILKVSRSTVCRLIAAGKIEAAPIGTGQKRQHFVIPETSLDAYLAAQLQERRAQLAAAAPAVPDGATLPFINCKASPGELAARARRKKKEARK